MRRDHKQFKSQKLIDAKPFRTTKIKSKKFFFRSGVQKQEHVFVMFSPPFSIVPAVVVDPFRGVSICCSHEYA